MALASVSPTLDQTRDVLRLKHYSLRTERSYCDWIERCDDLRRPAVWSSKSARPAKDFESWETVSIAESAQCSLVQRLAQLVNHESTRMDTNHQMNFSVSREQSPRRLGQS